MRNRNSAFLTAAGVIGMIIGVLTFIFLIGIPLVIGASKFLNWAKISDEELLKDRDSLLVWGVVFTILLFPIGLLGLVPSFNLDGQVSSAINSTNPTINKDKEFEAKLEKIKKLHELKEQGVLSEEDFKIAKERILN